LLEFFEFCTTIANRFNEYLKQPYGNKYGLKTFLERNQAIQPSFDIWRHENGLEFDIFVEKFEQESTTLEGEFLEHTQ